MSQYSIMTGPLNEAGEDISAFAGELGKLHERINTVFTQWPDGFPELRRQLAEIRESVYKASNKTRGLGITLYEIIDCYTRAERSAMGEHHRDLNMQSSNQNSVTLPNIRSSSGVVMLDRTLLPDWLQNVVLEYERKQS